MNQEQKLIYKPPTSIDETLKILEESWSVEIDSEAEYSSDADLRFTHATLHDSEGKEIEIPKCQICDAYMSMALGKESYQWLCHQGCK